MKNLKHPRRGRKVGNDYAMHGTRTAERIALRELRRGDLDDANPLALIEHRDTDLLLAGCYVAWRDIADSINPPRHEVEQG